MHAVCVVVGNEKEVSRGRMAGAAGGARFSPRCSARRGKAGRVCLGSPKGVGSQLPGGAQRSLQEVTELQASKVPWVPMGTIPEGLSGLVVVLSVL